MTGERRPSNTTTSPSSVSSTRGARSRSAAARYSRQNVGNGTTCESAETSASFEVAVTAASDRGSQHPAQVPLLLLEESIQIDVIRIEQPLVHRAAEGAQEERRLRIGVDVGAYGSRRDAGADPPRDPLALQPMHL